MRLLLDTHAFLWWLAGHPSLSRKARSEILDGASDVFVSTVSAWEIATKYRLGKLPEADIVARDVITSIEGQRFVPLPVSVAHGQAAGALPGFHRDPFDRMLIAQAMLEDMTLVSNEQTFDAYGVKRLW
ncbi:MAG: type II toxin-antitoxin system VapC family toxin [Alphaproteobacteria bacterium]|nr:type II toxin-antitoxin system VapC family toxin [Alphaproteobacteria bacterium]